MNGAATPIDRRTLLAGVAAAPLLAGAGRAPSARNVDPFIGTDGTGHTSPAASRPFGMVAPGPDNADSGWAYTSGYQYRAPRILGFSQTRASGTGIPELGDILLMPMQTPPMQNGREGDFASGYDKASEVARPGYYAVRLTDNAVAVELTATPRVALHRYRFGRGGRAWLLADFQHGLRFFEKWRVTASAVAVGAQGIEGSVASKNWTTRTVAFALAFDRPIAAQRLLPAVDGEKAPRWLLGFDLGDDGVLMAKAALSTTDVAGAQANMTELPGWDFATVAAAATADWDALLARATIDADPATRRIFDTALYHAFLHPSVVSDVDGRYRGPTGAIASARGRAYYSTLSLWDIFRAASPLYTLLLPDRVDDFVLTLLDHARAAGTLPLWPIWGGETGTMIGDPALPVIADAWAKGFRGFDGAEALAAMVRTSTTDHQQSNWRLFDRYGYYPTDKLANEAVSKTLEAGIGDAATARMAAMLGDTAAAQRFGLRARAYAKLVDPETKLARGRDSTGKWRTPFDPLQATSPVSGCRAIIPRPHAWQYSWTPALHDVPGLIAAMGGKPAFTAMLDRFFTLPASAVDKFQGQEGAIGQYAHGNEPSHHIAWLYAFTDAPWRGHALVRRIAREFYKDTPDGILGNEDAGQMSAWYIFATLGFYPVDPSSGSYVLGLPLVRRAELALAGGRRLVVTAPPAPTGALPDDGAARRRGDPGPVDSASRPGGGRPPWRSRWRRCDRDRSPCRARRGGGAGAAGAGARRARSRPCAARAADGAAGDRGARPARRAAGRDRRDRRSSRRRAISPGPPTAGAAAARRAHLAGRCGHRRGKGQRHHAGARGPNWCRRVAGVPRPHRQSGAGAGQARGDEPAGAARQQSYPAGHVHAAPEGAEDRSR